MRGLLHVEKLAGAAIWPTAPADNGASVKIGLLFLFPVLILNGAQPYPTQQLALCRWNSLQSGKPSCFPRLARCGITAARLMSIKYCIMQALRFKLCTGGESGWGISDNVFLIDIQFHVHHIAYTHTHALFRNHKFLLAVSFSKDSW